jgi:tRNA(Ile)-lysidine synthase
VRAADTSFAFTGIFDGLTGFSRVAVAVSGGSDSMALLRLVLAWRQQAGGPREVFALTFDHGLRAESAAEAARVKNWCKGLEIPHDTIAWAGTKPESGIQAKARNARYDALTHWCRAAGVPVLLTGHTADDQAETVAMRQIRTRSDRALAGIWSENEWHGVKLLRPLLRARRQRLRDYLVALGQSWIDDPSNENARFERVRVRKSLEERDVEALVERAQASQLRVQDVDKRAVDWLKAHVVVEETAVLQVARLAFNRLDGAGQNAALRWLVQVAGTGNPPERAALEGLQDWLVAMSGSRRSLNGCVISARSRVISLMREPSRMSNRFLAVPPSGTISFDGRFQVEAPAGSLVGPMGAPPLLKRWKDVPALAFAALPAVKLASGEVVCAVKSEAPGVSATLCERFRL